MAKNKYPSIVVLTVLAAAPSISEAACFAYYCQARIHSMSISDDRVLVRLQGGLSGLTNCTPEQVNYVTLYRSNPNYSTYYATFLAAYHAKDTILVRTVDSSIGCTVAYIGVPE